MTDGIHHDPGRGMPCARDRDADRVEDRATHGVADLDGQVSRVGPQGEIGQRGR
jgi:hypothetical protein